MLSSLTAGVSGLENYQQEMDVIGNNIANINTTGFKSGTVNFADTFSNVLQFPSSSTAASSGTNSVQIGTGVTITGVSNNWGQGSISPTGVSGDLAINGSGFFTVKDSISGASYATRAGVFTVDSNGYLVTDNGQRVQGYTDGSLSTIGDVQINATGAPATSTGGMVSFNVNSSGKIIVTMGDGSTFTRGQVLLQNYTDPQQLINQGNNLYTNLAAAGPLASLSAPDTNGLGNIQSGALESSNVDLSASMANLITAQRAFEANSKIITTSDEVLQIVNHLKQ
jgi:flagellar hook protein FlgE